jgi:glycosyltransferase involved in cell wall biosynthesis
MSEMQSLAEAADGFIVFNDFYRQRMGELLHIPAEKFHRTALGVEEDHFTEIAKNRASDPKPSDAPRVIGYFARQCPEKGFDLMVEAFLDLATRPGFEDVEFHCGGWLSEKDRAFYEEQVNKIDQRGLSHRFNPVGSPDFEGKISFFRDLDVFSVPARFVEPKGIYALEAMACGIPVVAPDHGAFPELIESSGGGRLVPREDAQALADSLGELLADESERKKLGEAGREWVTQECGREAMARTTAEVFQEFLDESV